MIRFLEKILMPISDVIVRNEIEEPKIKARPIDFKITLFTIADTHDKLRLSRQIIFPSPDQYDLCILLGDISENDLEIIFKNAPKEKTIGILGNWDKHNGLQINNIPDIHNKLFEFNGIRFVGLQGCFKYERNMPGYTRRESRKLCSNLPPVEIFVTHHVPYGLSKPIHIEHVGNPDINNYATRERIPLILCGHNHEHIIKELPNGTLVVETHMLSIIEINNGRVVENKIETGLC